MDKIIEVENEIIKSVVGPIDTNLKKIEKKYNISIVIRDGKIKLIGDDSNVRIAYELINLLIDRAKHGVEISEQELNYCMDVINDKNDNIKESIASLDEEIISRTVQGKPIKAKTIGQKKYIDSIKKNMITFGIGPAGTGKTYLGMCMAIEAFKKGEVQRLILTRPAIEAGEKLGFLPGDLQSKIDPYLRPLYDALYQIMGIESFQSNVEKGLIEVAPLAYMRGRTLDNAFIILDEAQNTTIPLYHR